MRILLSFLAFAVTPALAQTSDPAPAPSKHVMTFGADNPGCLEWTDGCVVCKRLDADAAACSTPGVACLPQEPTCKKAAP